MKYPEHEKLKEINDQSQLIGEFLEWLDYETGYRLCEMIEGRVRDNWIPISVSHQKVLAQYFNIDLDKIEQEKRQMLEEIRNASK